MSFRIRDLGVDDLPAAVTVHMKAFPDSALTKLGREAVRRYYEWQIIGPHDALNIGAFDENDTLLGFCFGGIFRGALGGFLEKNRSFLIRQVITHPWLLLNPLFRERARFAARRVFRRVTPRKPKPVANSGTTDPQPTRHFGILSIAVDPQYHGNGAARELMEYSERVAVERGFTRMGLTVHPSNGRAVRFYEKIGWHRSPINGRWTGSMNKQLTHVEDNDE